MIVHIAQSLEISEKEVQRIFAAQLYALTEGWYISLSDGTYGRMKTKEHPERPYDSRGRWVLCHESEPNHHNGDTFREFERDLEDPTMQVIRRACELKDALKRHEDR